MAAIDWLRIVDQAIHQVVADDRIKTDHLDGLLEQLLSEDSIVPMATSMLANRQNFWYSMHNQKGEPWDKYTAYLNERNIDVYNDAMPFVSAFLNGSFAERTRFLNILNAAIELDFRGQDNERAKYELRRTLSTQRDFYDFLSREMPGVVGQGAAADVDRSFLATLNSRQATLLIVALQLHRRKHETFPDRLADLDNFDAVKAAAYDYYSNDALHLFPTGFGRDFLLPTLSESPKLAVSGSQPLLWSSTSIKPGSTDADSLQGVWKLPADPNRILYPDHIFGTALLDVEPPNSPAGQGQESDEMGMMGGDELDE